MLKHRGFPGRMPSTDHQFVIRRGGPKGGTKLVARERYRDRSPGDKRADAAFLAALIQHFGDEPFERGNLDAGRLSWLLGREVIPVGKLDPISYEQLFRVDIKCAEQSFPELFKANAPQIFNNDDEDFDEEDD